MLTAAECLNTELLLQAVTMCRPVGQGRIQPAVTKQGRPFAHHSNDKQLKAWRKLVATDVCEVWGGRAPFAGPVSVTATWYYERPKNHFHTGKFAHVMREDAPLLPMTKNSHADTDHLQRALGDALQMAGVLEDDRQIVQWQAQRYYAAVGDPERCEYFVWAFVLE